MKTPQPKPWRYKLVEKKLTFWQSVGLLIRTWQWRTKRQDFVVVNPDSPEYDSAPFETSVIFARAFDVGMLEVQVIYKR